MCYMEFSTNLKSVSKAKNLGSDSPPCVLNLVTREYTFDFISRHDEGGVVIVPSNQVGHS